MSLAGCQINLIDVNFHLQKSLEIFDTNSADKNTIPKLQGRVKLPCLMPIRVKYTYYILKKRPLETSFPSCYHAREKRDRREICQQSQLNGSGHLHLR